MKEIYYVKRVDNSRLAPTTDPRESRRYLELTLLAAVVFGAVLYVAWQRFACVQYGYRLEVLQQDKQQWMEANRKLRLEEASLGDPVRIDTIARSQLGLAPLAPHQILGQPRPAAAAEQPVVAQVRQPTRWLSSPVKNVAAAVP